LTGICGKNTRLIYDLHLSIIEHGRRTCRAQNPRCGSCVLYGCCRFKDKKNYIS
jgi:endonuclease-3